MDGGRGRARGKRKFVTRLYNSREHACFIGSCDGGRHFNTPIATRFLLVCHDLTTIIGLFYKKSEHQTGGRVEDVLS